MEGRTTSTIMIPAPRSVVMSVIADFAAYPAWASMHSAEVLGEPGADGRAKLVRFEVDAGIFREQFVLRYEWDGDARVRWHLAEPGSVISAMSGAYILADRAAGTEVTFELTIAARFPMPAMLRRRAEQTVVDTALKGLRSRVRAAS
jgi:Polyketide cyclase / dehydrase and lipid transport